VQCRNTAQLFRGAPVLRGSPGRGAVVRGAHLRVAASGGGGLRGASVDRGHHGVRVRRLTRGLGCKICHAQGVADRSGGGGRGRTRPSDDVYQQQRLQRVSPAYDTLRPPALSGRTQDRF